jgi:hypothetical protein
MQQLYRISHAGEDSWDIGIIVTPGYEKGCIIGMVVRG